MLPAKPEILKCPHCGRKMCISSLLSGNTFDMVQWSDTKTFAPMLPSVSPVLKCPKCEKYFFYDNKYIVGTCRTHRESSWGWLSYVSLKEALEQLQPKGEDEITLRILLLQGYNDLYGGCAGTKRRSEAPTNERKYFENNARRIIELMPGNKIFCAELYRELGEFEQAITLLNDISDNQKLNKVVEQIKNHALRSNSNVFIVNGDFGDNCEREATQDDKMFKYNRITDILNASLEECSKKIIKMLTKSSKYS